MPIATASAPTYLHTPSQPQQVRRDPKAWETAKDFESQFLSTMTQSMFDGVKADSLFGGGQGEDMFRSMLVGQYSKEMTNAGGIGIADRIYSEILKLQEHGQ